MFAFVLESSLLWAIAALMFLAGWCACAHFSADQICDHERP